MRPNRPSPLAPASHLLPPARRTGARGRGALARAWPPPACRRTPSAGYGRHALSRASLDRLLVPIPSLLSLPLCPSGARRRRSPLPWPPSPPRLARMPSSSATSRYASPPKEATPDALQRPHRHRLRASAAGNPTVDSTPSVPPRARRESLRDRGEPPVISP